KGLGASSGSVMLTPNEHRVAEDRRDCYWLYVVTGCGGDQPKLHDHQDPARFVWHEVTQIAHYILPVSAMKPEQKQPDHDMPGGGGKP
ncbi:MAG: protein NO VEIN domain-containing protein, partial [Terriglobia bacterium]